MPHAKARRDTHRDASIAKPWRTTQTGFFHRRKQPMTGIILHHYEASPFSEKVRAVLGYKQLEWQSVLIPRIMPKPDLLALTGGYRKTPVMQIGRDVYADTHLITRQIEALAPEPSVFPTSDMASSLALEQLGDKRLFLAAVPVLFRPAARAVRIEKLGEEYLARFGADRAALFKGGHVERPDGAFSEAVLPPTLQALDTQLANPASPILPRITRSGISAPTVLWHRCSTTTPTCWPGPTVFAPSATASAKTSRPARRSISRPTAASGSLCRRR
jgi:glutathione S-transferase